MCSRSRSILRSILFGVDRPRHTRPSPNPSSIFETDSVDTDIEKAHSVSSNEKGVEHVEFQPSPQHTFERQSSETDISSRSGTFATFYPPSSAIRCDEKADEGSWNPSPSQIRPLIGIFALAVTVCCVFISLVVLVISNGQSTEVWPIQPTVYLAIIAAVANSSLVLARALAIPISFWYHSFNGASVASLERHWQVSHSLVRAILHIKHLSLLSVVCVATSFVIIDGPLLQKASTVVPATSVSNITLDLTLLPELPSGFGGYATFQALDESKMAETVSSDWMNDVPIYLSSPQCEGTVRSGRR